MSWRRSPGFTTSADHISRGTISCCPSPVVPPRMNHRNWPHGFLFPKSAANRSLAVCPRVAARPALALLYTPIAVKPHAKQITQPSATVFSRLRCRRADCVDLFAVHSCRSRHQSNHKFTFCKCIVMHLADHISTSQGAVAADCASVPRQDAFQQNNSSGDGMHEACDLPYAVSLQPSCYPHRLFLRTFRDILRRWKVAIADRPWLGLASVLQYQANTFHFSPGNDLLIEAWRPGDKSVAAHRLR